MRIIRSLTTFGAMAAVISLAACESDAVATDKAVRGRAYAQSHCAVCHAVGETGESPYMLAPPFRTLSARYPIENLAEALAEGIGVGHTGDVQMPEFVLSPEEIDDLLAHLVALGRASP